MRNSGAIYKVTGSLDFAKAGGNQDVNGNCLCSVSTRIGKDGTTTVKANRCHFDGMI